MMEKYNYRKDPHQDIDHVFRDLLPAHGMVERPAQVELSHQMLDAMLNGSIALCDAGTGIGKTYAYLVAGVVFRRYRSRAGLPNQPLLISTSSIALQGAIIHDYLPFLSKVMMADGMLDSPLRAVLRKGKSHYVCDARLMKRLQTANLDRKNPLAKAALLSMRDHLDLDMAPHLSGYDRERICVPPTCDCGKTECRYLCYLDVCASERYAIQVCNHNLLLADAIHRGSGKRSILPDSCAIVMDEAHKLTEIARQMFGITLEAGELHTLCRKLRREQFLLAAETLEDTAGLLLSEMAKPWSGDSSFSHFSIPLDGVERTLSVIHRQIRRMLTAGTRMELERVLDKTKLFCLHQPDMVYYTAEDETGGSMLCASATDLTAQLRQTLWQQDRPMILASGTLAVGSNFRRFKEETGLLAEGRVREHKVPFQYKKLLGYRKGPDGKPEIDPQEAETVRRIYRRYLDGCSLSQIQQELEADRVPTAQAIQRWSYQVIRNILTNERYIGDAMLGKTFTTDCISKRVKKNNGERGQSYVRNNHPAIIPREMFYRVQEEMARRSSKRKVMQKTGKTELGKYSAKYALSELLVCGECGTPYKRVTWARNEKKRIVWRCISRLEFGTKYCHNSPTLDEEKLHQAIQEAINEFVQAGTEVKEDMLTFTAMAWGGNTVGGVSLIDLRQKLKDITDQQALLLDQVLEHMDDEILNARLKAMMDEKQALQEQIAAAEQSQTHNAAQESRMAELREWMAKLEVNQQYSDEQVRMAVERITVVDAETIRIRFRYPGAELEKKL